MSEGPARSHDGAQMMTVLDAPARIAVPTDFPGGKNPDRHWRNARTLASHNPASCKTQALGAYELHGASRPTLGFF